MKGFIGALFLFSAVSLVGPQTLAQQPSASGGRAQQAQSQKPKLLCGVPVPGGGFCGCAVDSPDQCETGSETWGNYAMCTIDGQVVECVVNPQGSCNCG